MWTTTVGEPGRYSKFLNDIHDAQVNASAAYNGSIPEVCAPPIRTRCTVQRRAPAEVHAGTLLSLCYAR